MARGSTLTTKQAAYSVGGIAAAMHTFWVVLVAAGYGPSTVQWMKSIHFVDKAVTVLPFDATTAAAGIIGAFIAGAIIGWLFAVIWNYVGKNCL